MYLVKTPWWLKKYMLHRLHGKYRRTKGDILTFDDGPHPEVTPFVLNCLKQYNARATFFCIGKNVKDFPEVYQRIIDEGHKTGNHTHDHLNGWKTSDAVYLKNVMLARNYIDSNIFRPPYGRISRVQARLLHPVFNIIMWDVLSGDFDITLAPKKCLENVTRHTTSGSIIVFHDSVKAFKRLEYTLPKALKYFSEKGYEMKVIA
jgi:peptidoglycan/xylan/chitin deacetylase (PgdA/CDA1 family)